MEGFGEWAVNRAYLVLKVGAWMYDSEVGLRYIQKIDEDCTRVIRY